MLLAFSTLTVSVTAEAVVCSFGPGIIRRRLNLANVKAVEAVRNRWSHGWGIRLTPHGWPWSVSGLRAIEVELEDGRSFRIGSDEPEALANAIRSRIAFA